MYKKLLLMLVLVAMVFMVMGCPFLVSSEHTRKHVKAMDHSMVAIHRFFDRHFWLYDWDDPHVN